ncbi:hypothetical protein A2Z67_06220 [Candidatus Woesebacteria bacterium RBG_13_36_22]|uniref:Gp5/Type VI secretion system Vgr protein OB-fold domain-containing protein n=1 Tax=Candidatus Woesebacteria bacterium RBG_13_36_22 TaxID=1802478 RepID=A0A1F7WZ93_9BACT|nr:MAG: hypothetical protein A2Z67_06220 [Candidatus Woesebacteria bacterium RBG_13_36_22]
MAKASLGSNIVSTSKKVAESVMRKQPANRKAIINNVDNIDYKIDADIDLPVGDIILSSRSMVTPYAGDGYGFICSPRENQSVIVIPIDNDHNKSVIIGRTYDIDKEKPPAHNLGDVIFRHQLGSQWSFTYTEPITGSLNLDIANQLILTLDENESTASQLKFNISSPNTSIILLGQIVRVVLEYEATDQLYDYLNVRIEWETKVENDNQNMPFITISDANTIVGGPLYQSENTTTEKNYLISQYKDKYYGMILSPPKGNAQFSHYTGMGLFMDEYPSRIPISGTIKDDGQLPADGSYLKSWAMNTDSFLDDTLDKFGYLDDFPRGSLNLKHYSKSGLSIEEKIKKTYDLGSQTGDWNQSAIGLNLLLIRQTPKFRNLAGLNDEEKPLASFIMEDDCKNSYYNAVHLRIAQDNTAVQRISDEEIIYYDVQHLVEGDTETRIENALPGTRPSRLQFYDLKKSPTSVDINDFKCFHDDGTRCKLNIAPNGTDLPTEERQATYGSGREDTKLDKKKCPNWPGCVEGHYTHQNIDLPLSIRNTDIRVDNIDLLMKPKANAELVHYTGSGIFFEEQLLLDETGDVDYTKVSTYHAPLVELRLREWDYVPKSDGTTEINYDSGSKNNAHEPKRYDLCKLKFETIYGTREENYLETGEDKIVSFEDKHDTYNTASKITLAQTIYGNKITPDDSIQLGNRLVFEDLLEGEEPNQTVPADIWEESTNATDSAIEGSDADMRLILPKGKLELMHYTNSGLVIKENELSATTHKMSMELLFNHWDTTNYRPMNPIDDALDQVGTIKWEETADSADPTASLVDFYVYHNTYRDQHLTLDTPTAWGERTGAYMAIRESDNAEQGKPVLELSDSLNVLKMDAGDAKTVEITNRENQFEDGDAGTNKILLDAVNQLVSVLNGQEGSEDNSIVLDKKNKKIVISDANGNIITMDSTGITIDAGGTKVIYNNSGDINISAGGSIIDVKEDGDIDINSAAAINITGTAGITITDPAVTITGGTLKVDGIAAPSGTGGFCGIPLCVFSGAGHIGNMISGT